mmetsp:Transcript_125335/g.401391  ORF Transcript_125335/g.401391 Transcript_125335/m.401391 type:complete len:202 (+) Transcript_125335:33-638(+)
MSITVDRNRGRDIHHARASKLCRRPASCTEPWLKPTKTHNTICVQQTVCVHKGVKSVLKEDVTRGPSTCVSHDILWVGDRTIEYDHFVVVLLASRGTRHHPAVRNHRIIQSTGVGPLRRSAQSFVATIQPMCISDEHPGEYYLVVVRFLRAILMRLASLWTKIQASTIKALARHPAIKPIIQNQWQVALPRTVPQIDLIYL